MQCPPAHCAANGIASRLLEARYNRALLVTGLQIDKMERQHQLKYQQLTQKVLKSKESLQQVR